jgi:hypothetical protein
MKATEIRIGNFVQDPRSTVKFFAPIIEINTEYVKVASNPNKKFDFSEIEPISLSENWLLKFEFKYRNECRGFGAILDLKKCPENTEVPEWKFHKSVAFIRDKNDIYLTMLAHPTAYKIYFVHQLQNLYFALTGEELIYNPKNGN